MTSSSGGGRRGRAAWASEAVRACPYAAVVLLTEDAELETYRAALRAGVRAVVHLPLSAAALASAIADAARTSRSHDGVLRRGAAGAVHAVAGARGGVGATAVALALATGTRALLVDLTRSRAGLAFTLGGRPRPIACRPGPGGRCAAQQNGHRSRRAPIRGFGSLRARPAQTISSMVTTGVGVRASCASCGLAGRRRCSTLAPVLSGAPREAFAAADRAAIAMFIWRDDGAVYVLVQRIAIADSIRACSIRCVRPWKTARSR